MRIIFCGGGTVGHISPAIAIAEAVMEKDKNSKILFIGRDGGGENKVITNSKFELKTLQIHGLERKITLRNIKNIFTALKAEKKAKDIICEFSPDVVIGTGGYVCWPVISAAGKMKIPTVLHESNACPGLAVKMLASKCTRVLLGLDGSQKEFKRQDNIFVIGNPVKSEFSNVNRRSARRKLGLSEKDILISSFGGSGGSDILNSAIISLMSNHISKQKNLYHIHSCGRKYFRSIKENHPELTDGKFGCTIKPYIDNMAEIMAASDIVISRCGAITLAEICAVGCPAVLIPSPNVTNDHQRKNAELLASSGAAVMILEDELSDKLSDTVKRLENDSALRLKMGNSVKKFHIKNAKENAAWHLFDLSKSKK